MKARIRFWASAPISFPRWMLTGKYALFALLGIVGFFSGIPSLDIVAGTYYTFHWAIALTAFAIAALIGSLSPKFETLEKIAGVGIVAVLATYIISALILLSLGFGSRAAFAVVLLIVTLLSATRAYALLRGRA